MNYILKQFWNKSKYLPVFLIMLISFLLKCNCNYCPWASTKRCNCEVNYQLVVQNRSNANISAIFEDHYSEYSDTVIINPSTFDLQPNKDTIVSLTYTWADVGTDCSMSIHDVIKYRQYVLLKAQILDQDSSSIKREYEIYPWDRNKYSSLSFCEGGCTCYEEPGYCEHSYNDSLDVH